MILAALAAVLVSVSPASAQLRDGIAADAQDQLPSLDGWSTPDIEHVRISYDSSSGALAVTLRLYGPAPATTSAKLYLELHEATPEFAGSGQYCGGTGAAVSMIGALAPQSATFSLRGFSGTVEAASVGVSPDGREYTWTLNDARFAGRDLRCISAHTYFPSPAHCGNRSCSYISYTSVSDTVEQAGFFAGFAPPSAPPKGACENGLDDDGDGKTDWPSDDDCESSADTTETPVACKDGIDNDKDGLTDLKDPGCRGENIGTSEADPAPVRARFALKARARKCTIDTEVEVLPDIKPEELFPFKRIRMTVRGAGKTITRKLPLAENTGYVYNRLKRGRYKVTAFYEGDKWRSKSVTRTKTVRITRRSCR